MVKEELWRYVKMLRVRESNKGEGSWKLKWLLFTVVICVAMGREDTAVLTVRRQ